MTDSMTDEAAARQERIRRLVDTWPPFTPEQRAQLSLLLAAGRVHRTADDRSQG